MRHFREDSATIEFLTRVLKNKYQITANTATHIAGVIFSKGIYNTSVFEGRFEITEDDMYNTFCLTKKRRVLFPSMCQEQPPCGVYLYVVGFYNYPNLLKIGITISLEDRMKQLSRIHGEITSLSAFTTQNSKACERFLHKILSNQREPVDGEGGTEFFIKDGVHAKVQEVVKVCGGKSVDGVLTRCARNAKLAEQLDERVMKDEN